MSLWASRVRDGAGERDGDKDKIYDTGLRGVLQHYHGRSGVAEG
jgi:hypothetical protein